MYYATVGYQTDAGQDPVLRVSARLIWLPKPIAVYVSFGTGERTELKQNDD